MVKGGTRMENKQPASVQFFVHEAIMCRMERTITRMQILCGIMAAVTALTIAAAALGWI